MHLCSAFNMVCCTSSLKHSYYAFLNITCIAATCAVSGSGHELLQKALYWKIIS